MKMTSVLDECYNKVFHTKECLTKRDISIIKDAVYTGNAAKAILILKQGQKLIKRRESNLYLIKE